MKITCESCGAKYTIADDKVRGRKVKIRCKGCGTPIVVDGQASSGGAEPVSSEAAPVSVEPPASPSLSYEFEWSVNLSDTEQLTLSTQQIIERWHAGQITADAFVWREGMADWQPILESADLAPLLAEPARVAVGAEPSIEHLQPARAESTSVRPAARAVQPRKSSRPAPAAARVTGGRAQGGHDLFASVARAGGDDEEVHSSAPALPQAGSGRGTEEKATGARNENSVLFSLDALKAGFSGSSKPEAPKPITASDDPFGMGNAPALAGFGGGGTLSFSLSDNQNLLNAPPPPEPPRVAPAAFSPSAPGASSQKRTILFAGLGVGLLAVGLALGLGLSGGGEGKDKSESGESALSKTDEKSSDAKSEAKNEETAAKAEEAKSAEEPKKEEEPAKDPTQPEETSKAEETAKAEEPSTPSSTRPKSGGGSKAPVKEKEAPKSAGPAQPFNKGAAVSALSAASSSAQSCKKLGGPTGTGKVQVTFAPSGRVTSATAGPPFAGTSVGGCIAGIFRKATVPPFSGSALTVSKSVTIN